MVESQLSANAGLRGELESLRRTVDSVRGLPRAKAPAGLVDEVVDRLARRELLDEGASRGGEVARFVIHLRRFAVAAVIVLAAGVGWRYWSASSNPPVIGESAVPTVAVPGAARPMPAPTGRGGAPLGDLAKTELAARTQDRDAAALNERTESAEGVEKLAFGNQLPGGAFALNTRAKAMGADNGGPRGFSTRADAMLPIATSSAPVLLRDELAMSRISASSSPNSGSFDANSAKLEAESDASKSMIAMADYRLSVKVSDPAAFEDLNKSLDAELALQQNGIDGPILNPTHLTPIRWSDAALVEPTGMIDTKYSDYPFRMNREKACRIFEIMKRSTGDSTIWIDRIREPRHSTEVKDCGQLEQLIFATTSQVPTPDQVVVVRTISERTDPTPTTRSAPVAP